MDWEYVISQENQFGKNLVPKTYSDNWKNTTPGQYNVEVDSGWVDSSQQAVEYAMDPRNFLNDIRIFQFETLSYSASENSTTTIDKILYGTEFYQNKVSYLDSNGNTINMSETYADLILRAGQKSAVSTYHLASRIKQEVGPFLSHHSISGKVQGYEGLYNFYNIGATSSTEPMGAIKNGLQYAKDGKGAGQTIKNKYLIPWNTKEKAITGGGIFIGSSYINVGQNTVYLQKFDVNDDRGNNLFTHQYMTNILAPYSESKSIYNGYQKSGILDMPISFIIPVYNNMPSIQTESPNINLSDFEKDNTKVYCNATNVNIRTGPGTSYEKLTVITKDVKMTRISKGIGNGEKWDKVQLENGMIGYIFQTYVTEVSQNQIEKIELFIDSNILQKGERKQLQVKISPSTAEGQKINYISSNPNIATIDDKGNIQALKSGTTTIIVKAEEGSVQSQIEITIYSKVTGIYIEQKEVYISVEDIFKLNAYVEPDDASNTEITFKSADNQIVTVDKNGTITAQKEGETTVSVLSAEDENIKTECKVTVIRKMDDAEIYFEYPLKSNDLEVSGLDYKQNTVDNIKSKITSNLEIEIVDKNNKILLNNDLVGTGSKIQVKENGKVLKEYQILLYGDVNGDGKINSIDLLVLQRHILEIENLDVIYQKSANIRKNANRPTSIDLLLIQRHILELQIIEQ